MAVVVRAVFVSFIFRFLIITVENLLNGHCRSRRGHEREPCENFLRSIITWTMTTVVGRTEDEPTRKCVRGDCSTGQQTSVEHPHQRR